MARRRVTFPDGTTVTACAIADRRAASADRDIGLYLDPAWDPDWEAEVIDWPDFGVPEDGPAAARQILSAFNAARSGLNLEVGCLGGLGRTGTALACMAILAGVATTDAVSWVRTEYDIRAVETPGQEAWVVWFGGWLDEQR